MAIVIDPIYSAKAEALKRPLRHRTVRPVSLCEIKADTAAFQGLKTVPTGAVSLPLTLNSGEKLLLDFGDHCVGYLHLALGHVGEIRITDSPIQLRFTFGEFPLEIVTDPADYKGSLGSGWLQNETKSVVFTPYSGALERRYSFRYVQIERLDRAQFPVLITDLFADCVSAVELSDAPAVSIPDPTLKSIYDMSLKTLKECEQDVFEDGPKRDRRLWIGDLRLQAITDYVTFRNLDLVKRCIYLFAAYRADHKMVAPCVFPDSPPCVDAWTFMDYSLFFIPCLYDYVAHTGDRAMAEELYEVAWEQAKTVSGVFDFEAGTVGLVPFIDWCPFLEKEVAILGVYLYTLKQLQELAVMLGKETAWIEEQIGVATKAILQWYVPEQGLFVTPGGQVSWHSQIWAVLGGVFSPEESRALMLRTREANPEIRMHTPYMTHYYLEALWACGLKEEVMEEIRHTWGQIEDAGFDCCPEIFNPADPLESPYGAPEINSACHAWSCTPAYWIKRYYESEGTV